VVILTPLPQKSPNLFMTKHHYVYHSYEEWGREYIGVRSCDCLPEEDTKYFGSFCDKTFFPTEKTILFVCETREEAMEIEIKLHDFFDVAVNPQFANRSKQTSTKFDTTGVIASPRTKEWKQAHSKIMTGRTGALSPTSKAIIAIRPDGTELHFGGVNEAARRLEWDAPSMCARYLKPGKQPKQGKWKGWQVFYENSEGV